MISAVIKKSGQVFNITNNTGVGFPESAEAGEFVKSMPYSGQIGDFISILTSGEGVMVPYLERAISVSGARYRYVFVMPASDVTISYYEKGD